MTKKLQGYEGEFQHHLEMEDMQRWEYQDRTAVADIESQEF